MTHLPPSYQRLVRACCYLCDLAWLEHPDHRSRLVLGKNAWPFRGRDKSYGTGLDGGGAIYPL